MHTIASERINRTPGVAGGDACVRDTRIAVWTLVRLKQLGRAEADIVTDFPGLTPDDLTAVWDYYRHHTAEIDHAAAENSAET